MLRMSRRIVATIREPDKDRRGRVVAVIIEPYEIVSFKEILKLACNGTVFYVKNGHYLESVLPFDRDGDGKPDSFVSASGDEKILDRLPVVSKDRKSLSL